MTLPPGLQFERAAWMDQAACRGRGLTDLFFSERGDIYTSAEARAVCADCPARLPCLDFALATKEQHGIYGGLSTRERNKLRRPGVPRRAAATVDHCAHGHPYNDENTYMTADGSKRRCRRCAREASERKRRADGIPERGVPVDGEELADVIQIRRPA